MSHGLHTSSPSAPSAAASRNPDADMAIHYFVDSTGQLCVFHDRSWSKPLSWLDYNIDDRRLDFVMEDGAIRNFGIAVDPAVAPYFENTSTVSVIHLNQETREIHGGVDLPLILHTEKR